MKKILAVTLLLAASPVFGQTQQSNTTSQSGSVATTASSAQAVGGSGGSSSGGSASNNLSFDSHATYEGTDLSKSVPGAILPALVTSNGTCMGSVSGAGTGPGFGVSFGSTYVDDNCDRRFAANQARADGKSDLATEIMCGDDATYDADFRKAVMADKTQDCINRDLFAIKLAEMQERGQIAPGVVAMKMPSVDGNQPEEISWFDKPDESKTVAMNHNNSFFKDGMGER